MWVETSFVVWGPAVGKQRATPIVERGKLRGKITPKKTLEYESAVRDVANLMMPRDWPLDRRYELHVEFLGRPDVDNVYKAVSDALNKIAYNDDRQVDYGTARRIFDGKPRTVVKVVVLP